MRAAQVLLNAAGANLTVHAPFGPLGETAVENFQQSVELPVTGALDTVTWRSLLGNIILATQLVTPGAGPAGCLALNALRALGGID